jgi:hypothetical protein
VVREVARHDYDQAGRVLGWPVREVLLAYVERMRAAALDQYNQAVLVWAIQSPHMAKPTKPPRVPAILK